MGFDIEAAQERAKFIKEDKQAREDERTISKMQEALPSWITDGKGVRGPQDAKATETVPTAARSGVTTSTPAQFFPPATGGGVTQEVAVAPHPFKVFVVPGTGGAGPQVKILGGVMAHVQVLDKTIPAQSGFTVFLKCTIGVSPPFNYRSEVENVEIVTNADGAVASETAGGTGISQVTWVDETTRLAGRYYIKVADVYPDGNSLGVIQYLRAGYQSFVLSASDVIVVN